MRQQFDQVHPCPNAPIAVTLRCVLAMLNCTEVDGRHRNGWSGYTKVYEPARGDSRFGCAADLNRKHSRSRRGTNDAPQALSRRPTRSRHMVRAHHVNLAGLFWISPIGAAENGRTRLQEG
jgi:hypothetical protein